MAVPPTIPTSFVPKQPVEMRPRHSESHGNMFLFVSFVLAGLAILAAIGVFAYGHFLTSERDSKAAELEAKQQSVSQDTVESFLRLRNRLTIASDLLNNHVLLSQFFDVLETSTVAEVRFLTLDLSVKDDQSAELKMTGVARNFNALAAQSASFALDKRIKQAIFSGIMSNETGGGVTFSLTAVLDPRFVKISNAVPQSWTPPAAEEAPAADSASSPQATTTP